MSLFNWQKKKQIKAVELQKWTAGDLVQIAKALPRNCSVALSLYVKVRRYSDTGGAGQNGQF